MVLLMRWRKKLSLATVAVQTQLSGRLLEVGFTEGDQEAQPVTAIRSSALQLNSSWPAKVVRSLIAHIRPGQQARYLN